MTTADLGAGRLEQACPDCGTREAAGSYCTKCLRPMTADDHRPTVRSEAQRAASSRNGHLRAKRAAGTEKTAKSVDLSSSGYAETGSSEPVIGQRAAGPVSGSPEPFAAPPALVPGDPTLGLV